MIWYLVIAAVAQGISFSLKGKGKTQCFKQNTQVKTMITFAYVVSGGKDQNVVTTIVDSTGRTFYASPAKSREGKFDLAAEPGKGYQLCFLNKDGSEKIISFDIYPHEGLQEDQVATQDEIGPLRNSLRKLSRGLDTVYRNIQFYERREATHRDLAEVTCDRVMISAFLKMAVLVIISSGQIYMLRSFFNNKRGTGV